MPRNTPKIRRMAAVVRRDEKDGVWRCRYCRIQVMQLDVHISWELPYPELDHIQPKSLGGSGVLANMALACQGCNVRKGAKLLDELPVGWTEWRSGSVSV